MALYNVERPMTFDELLGQEKNVKIFREILKNPDNLPNAFLFIGVRGTGKTSSARLFERALNCEHPREDGSPCNECPSCKEILAGNSMDVIELDAASHGGVDDVHEVLKMVQYAPIHKKKILVLDEVHMLSNAAFNALLKTIEEPPADVVFIFCTTEEHKVPATIVSRCRRFVFERISDEVIEGKLAEICKKNEIPYEEEALGIISRAAKGGMRDALSIFEQFMAKKIETANVKEVLGIADEDAVFGILKAAVTGDVVSSTSILRELLNRGKNSGELLKALIDALIDTVYTIQSGEIVKNTKVYLDGIYDLINALNKDASKALYMVGELSKVYEVSRKDSDMSYALEMTLMKMVDYQSELAEIKARIEALENRPVAVSAPASATVSAVSTAESVSGVSMPVPAEEETEEFVPTEDFAPTEEEIPFEESSPVDMTPVTAGTDPLEEFLSQGAYEQGEDLSLSSLLEDEADVTNTEPEETPADQKKDSQDETTEDTPTPDAGMELFGSLFDLGSARQF